MPPLRESSRGWAVKHWQIPIHWVTHQKAKSVSTVPSTISCHQWPYPRTMRIWWLSTTVWSIIRTFFFFSLTNFIQHCRRGSSQCKRPRKRNKRHKFWEKKQTTRSCIYNTLWFLGYQKHKQQNQKMGKSDFFKINEFRASKSTIRIGKKQLTEWVFKSYLWQETKCPYKSIIRRQIAQFWDGQNTWTNIPTKKISKWPKGTWKDAHCHQPPNQNQS